MPFTIAVHRENPYLYVVVTGDAALADLCALADLVAALHTGTRNERALVNLLDARHTLTFTQHLQLGAYIADKLGAFERFASVVPEPMRTGASEKAAQKLGLHMRTFTALQPAIDWLQEPRPSDPPPPQHSTH